MANYSNYRYNTSLLNLYKVIIFLHIKIMISNHKVLCDTIKQGDNIMARFKLSFDSYIKSDKPTKSLINFLIKNGSIYFTINEKDSNCQHKWKPYLFSENDGIKVSSVGNNKYRITFDKYECKCGDIVFIRGTIANEQGKSYSVNDEIYRVSSELDVYITADDSTYTDFSNLQVYLLPNIASVTGNIRLNHYPVRSDYDICIPIYDDKKASLQTYKIYQMATSEELNGLSAVANDSTSHLKIEFQKCKSKENNGSDEIKMSLYDGETLLGFTSWQENTSIYVSNLSEMQLHICNNDVKEAHYVHEYVHFFDFDDALDFSSLTNYESVIAMNFTDIEKHAHMLLPKDYSENGESPFYNYASPINKKSYTSLKLFDRFKNVYTHTSNDNSSIVQQEPKTYDVLFAKVNESVNLPVTFDVYTSVKNPNDLIPYSEFAKAALSSSNKANPICKIKLASKSNSDENFKITYQLRTTSFVIKYNDNTNVPVYYKIGIYALDGTQKSTDILVNELKTSSMLTDEWIKSGEHILPIIALSKYVPNNQNETTQPEYYYCVGKSITNNKTSMIKMHNLDLNMQHDSYISVPYNALVPITKVNESTSTKELKGLMFLQLCNTDGTETTTDFIDVTSISTNIDGTSTEVTIKCFDLIDHDIEGGTFIHSREIRNVSLISDDE